MLLAGQAAGQSLKPAVSCESLAKASLPGVTIVSAQTVAAGDMKMAPGAALPPSAQAALGPAGQARPAGQAAPGAAPAGRPPRVDLSKLPSICRVEGTVLPSADDVAKFEVWLPSAGWNGSTLTITHPTSAGGNVNTEVIDALNKGFGALLNMSPSFDDWATAGKSADQLLDQGYRTGHAMLVAAKAIANALYGTPVKHALYEGCSEGGREGFNAAHHYPADYDGIIVGGSGNQFARINAAQLYPAWFAAQDRARFISKDEWSMIHKAVVDACDEIDGVKDRIINDPRTCHWDPNSLLCKGEKTDSCLTAPQIEELKAAHQGPVDPVTHESIFPGPVMGGELQLPEFSIPDVPMHPAYQLYASLVENDPKWDFKTMDLHKDFVLAMQKVGPALHTAPADLKDFVDHGGKMIIWDGWNDYNSPKYWIQYLADMQKDFGAAKVDKKVAVYFLPGVQHCGGGEGADSFSKLDAIASWVETGKAPESIPSSKIVAGKTTMTRPVCRYPQVSKYKGTGDPNATENWTCVAGKPGL